MTDPMTPERLAEIRTQHAALLAQSAAVDEAIADATDRVIRSLVAQADTTATRLGHSAVGELLAEIDRLRARLAAKGV